MVRLLSSHCRWRPQGLKAWTLPPSLSSSSPAGREEEERQEREAEEEELVDRHAEQLALVWLGSLRSPAQQARLLVVTQRRAVLTLSAKARRKKKRKRRRRPRSWCCLGVAWEYWCWCFCWLGSTADTNLRQSAEHLKKLTHLCEGGLVNASRISAMLRSTADTRFAFVLWCLCTRCSHLQCGHHFSARYPAVTCLVCAAPEEYENVWIFRVMISRSVSVLGEQLGPTMDTRSCVSGQRLGDFPFFYVKAWRAVCTRCSHLEIGHYSSSPCFSHSLVRYSSPEEYKFLDFSGDDFMNIFRKRPILGATVDTCSCISLRWHVE